MKSPILRQQFFRPKARVLNAAIATCFIGAMPSVVWANPSNPTVVSGSATFSQAGNVLTVTNSNGAIINWDKFSIGSGETTYFLQSSSSSSVLNRVLSSDPSVILGTLSSNGKVWLINPAGIMVGAGARVNVASFVASTLDISNANFLAGKMQFNAAQGAGSVVNQGTITTPSGGSVYLLASSVTNSGIINAPNGEVLLAAGQSVTLLDTGTPGVKVEITGTEGTATNLGAVLAEAGRIGLAGVLVRNSGTLNASSVVSEGGRIFLKASQDAYVDGDGRIVTTGSKGGQVEVLGNRVAVTDNAKIDASGSNGGGTVLIGGDFQGKNGSIQNATATYLGKNASIQADATTQGDGGKVILWADGATSAEGKISARGGSTGGNGGLVEVSGKHYLDYRASVDVTAVRGTTGQLYLDPDNIEIVSGSALGPYNTGGGGGSPWAFISEGDSANPSQLGWDNIVSQLGSANVYVMGTNITVSGSRTYTSNNALNLLAAGSISASNVSVINNGTGALNLYAGWDSSVVPSNSSALPQLQSSCGWCDITITGSTFKTGGTMNWQALGKIEIKGGTTSNQQSLVQAGSNQTFKATQILVYGGAADNTSATVESLSGTQKLTADQVQLYGGDNYGSAYNYSGSYAQILANGTQEIEITNGGQLLLDAGYSRPSSGNNNYAVIRQNASNGLQRVTVYGGGSIVLYGGSAGSGNWAELDGTSGSQVIGSSSNRASIALYGGLGGGTYSNGNDASIGVNDQSAGSLTVYGTSLSIYGGDAAYGGAGLGAPTQRIDLTGDLYMEGGSTYNLDKDYVPGSIAYIGSKYGADISIKTTESVILKGGIGSPVLIGALQGTATVNIENGSGRYTTIYSDINGIRGGVFIGSAAEFGTLSAVAATNPLFTNDVMMGAHTSIKSNGDVNIRSYGGNVGLGYVEATTSYGATIEANKAILDQNGDGTLNVKAYNVNLTSASGGVSGGLAISVDTSATNNLTAEVSNGATYGGISIRNQGSQPSGQVSIIDYSLYGGDILLRQAGNLTLSDAFDIESNSGDVTIESSGDITVDSSGFSGYTGVNKKLAINADGSVTIAGYVDSSDSSYNSTDIHIGASGNVEFQSGVLSGNNIEIKSTNGNVVMSDAGSRVTADGGVVVSASNLIMDNGAYINGGDYRNATADVIVKVSGNVTLDNGAHIIAANDVYLNMYGGESVVSLNNSSYVWADTVGLPQTIHINFYARASDGIAIDGANTKSTATGSGFFNGIQGMYTKVPAILGQGLLVSYMSSTSNVASNEITKTLQNSVNKNGGLTEQPVAWVPKVSTVSTSTTVQTIGGDSEDSFGGNEKKETKSNTSDGSNTQGKDNGKNTHKNQCS